MRAFHGTPAQEAYESIKAEGFRVGTWFAFNRKNAERFGGPYMFEGEIDTARLSCDVDWQFHILEPLPAESIVASYTP